ncbi:Olfactory Receptor 14A16, partial [Manis pentadactyla]
MILDEVTNHTGITEFLLLGFSEDTRMQTLQGVLFLVAYLAALLGNGLILTLITWDPQLHTPMYVFLKNLSLIDLCYISVTVPKFILNSLMNSNTISFLGCVFQVLFFAGFGSGELVILTVMSYDRYMAICRPLHYDSIMNKGTLHSSLLGNRVLDEMINYTGVTEFFFLGFSDDLKMHTIHGILFLMAYLAALLGNGLIITLITLDPQLHTPMYFFLKNLSFIDLCYISVTVPKFAFNSLMNRNKISFLGCVLQLLFFVTFAAAEFAILTVMPYDRYMAVCRPLHYETIMNKGACGWMVVASYVSAGIIGTMHTAATFSITFSSNKIHHFFCDIPQIMLISESNMNKSEVSVTAFVASISLACFNSILYSYVHILSAVSRISSLEGRSKALSTCFPHLAVVTVFLSTGALAYLKPASELKSIVEVVLSVFYTVVNPSVNPIIYSLRNKDIKEGSLIGMAGVEARLKLQELLGNNVDEDGTVFHEFSGAESRQKGKNSSLLGTTPLDDMINISGVTEFLLLGYSEDQKVQILHGVLFLVANLAALLGNGLIITLITWDPQLHTPMYFFLKNLSLIDLCYISVTVPKFALNSLMNRNTISFLGCIFQVLFFMSFSAADIFILTVMSYDCYVAIYHLLHYETIMNKGG